LPQFVAAAEGGDAVAEYALVGRSIQQGDQVEALRWLKRAAEHGHPSAQRELGGRYMVGRGVQQSTVEAARWYIRAAQQGDDATFPAVGALYKFGQGVEQDYVEAHKWYNLAAARLDTAKDPNNAEERDQLAARMTPAQVTEAQRRASAWQPLPEPSPCLEVFRRAFRERLQH
jgi:hypothetical protein